LRRFESLLVAGCALAIVWPALFGVRPRRGLILAVAMVAVVTQLVVEGYRWQLLPLYVVALGLGTGDLLSVERQLPWWRRASRPILGLIGLGMVALPLVVLPIPTLPEPSGPLAVGTISLALQFPERQEDYGPRPGVGTRRIMVQVWYPAAAVEDPPVDPWTEDLDIVGPAMSRRLGYPGFFLSHTRYTAAQSVKSAPPLAGTFPLVLYSHGYGGFRTIAVNQMEALASHGYVVMAADHTFGAAAVRFPDGAVATLDPEALPREGTVAEDVYKERAVTLATTFALDLAGIVDALEEGSAGPFASMADHVDLGRIGVMGHMVGGGAAVRFCLSDPRCQAVLGMDAWVEPVPDRIIAPASEIPMLFMRSAEWRGSNNDGRLRGMAERSKATTYWIGIEEATESDFVLTPLLSPLGSRLGLTGTIPAGRIIPIIDRFQIGFFDHVLLGAGAAAVEQNPFDEVTLEVIRPSS
jgi:predicted dienelactone hydrolase